MLSFFQRDSEPSQQVEPVPAVFPSIAGADIAAAFVGKRVGGDFYDSLRVSPERVLFGLLDIAGRREQNLGMLRAAQEIFRSLGPELFSPQDINESTAMVELCLRMNRRIIEVSEGVHSCPAFMGCYHERFGTLCYTNAGHTPGLLRDGKGISELGSTGLPLGLFSHATCEAPTMGMDKGAALLLVSRGVVECGGDDESTAEFGMDRIKEGFLRTTASPAQALCTSVLNAASQFNPNARWCNDLTVLALVRSA